MGIRENQARLSANKKHRFVAAVLALKNETPSQMGLTSRYDDYAKIH